ncbi:MAG: MFS transporter, partial [Deltaproteobacteria bacterium]|nr:MFS transporter [Deltaproteobacteria bacterium]
MPASDGRPGLPVTPAAVPLQAKQIQRVYLLLMVLSTLAASFIWGINTLFLLDAGLSNAEAFGANAFFTIGQVIFEVPTGVVADTRGRRTSYLLGAATLLVSTLLYLLMWRAHVAFWGWALASVLLGLGFTFFSGATEAWLVDALAASGFKGTLESVMAKGQIAAGVAMLTGSLAGGFVAQFTNLGVPYILRSVVLGLTFVAAFFLMKDVGFTPAPGKGTLKEVAQVFRQSLDHGLRNAPVRWLMLAAPFTMGVGIYAFYALQPYLLQLYGDDRAFWIAGLAAAIVAGTNIVAGLIGPLVHRLFTRRTHALLLATTAGAGCLALIGWTSTFWVAIALLIILELAAAVSLPMRQAYMNGMIPSAQRATVLSFDNLMGSAGGVVIQPALGRIADGWGYA